MWCMLSGRHYPKRRLHGAESAGAGSKGIEIIVDDRRPNTATLELLCTSLPRLTAQRGSGGRDRGAA